MRALEQVSLLRNQISQLEKSCTRLDSKFHKTLQILADITKLCDDDFAVLLEKVEVLLGLPIMELTDNGAQEMELGEFLENIVGIYSDFQDALVMLSEAAGAIRGGKERDD